MHLTNNNKAVFKKKLGLYKMTTKNTKTTNDPMHSMRTYLYMYLHLVHRVFLLSSVIIENTDGSQQRISSE